MNKEKIYIKNGQEIEKHSKNQEEIKNGENRKGGNNIDSCLFCSMKMNKFIYCL